MSAALPEQAAVHALHGAKGGGARRAADGEPRPGAVRCGGHSHRHQPGLHQAPPGAQPYIERPAQAKYVDGLRRFAFAVAGRDFELPDEGDQMG